MAETAPLEYQFLKENHVHSIIAVPFWKRPTGFLIIQNPKRYLNRTLPVTERRVFLCRYWYVDSIEAIAEKFGFSQSKVKTMLHRTRVKLRKQLAEEGLQ